MSSLSESAKLKMDDIQDLILSEDICRTEVGELSGSALSTQNRGRSKQKGKNQNHGRSKSEGKGQKRITKILSVGIVIRRATSVVSLRYQRRIRRINQKMIILQIQAVKILRMHLFAMLTALLSYGF